MENPTIKLRKFKRSRFGKRKTIAPVENIVIHSTGTRKNMQVRELDKLPYHFLITQSGRIINIRPIAKTDTTVELALLGGLDITGKHVDDRTPEQNDTLFNTIIALVEQFPRCNILGADSLYPYGFANPGFDVKKWLGKYIPPCLKAA